VSISKGRREEIERETKTEHGRHKYSDTQVKAEIENMKTKTKKEKKPPREKFVIQGLMKIV
jgi:hypothetical protein